MLKKPYCHYFNTTGKCRFGKHCRFLHDSEITSNSAPLSINKDEAVKESSSKPHLEAKQICSRSENQQQNHESLNSDQVFASADISSLSIKDQAEPASKDEAVNKSVKKKQPSKAKSSEAQICKNYAQTKFCRFGNRCRFQHIVEPRDKSEKKGDVKTSNNAGRNEEKVQDEDEVADATGSKQVEDVETSAKSKDLKTKQSKKVCYFYNRGYCRLGRNCGFLHPGWNGPANKDKILERAKSVEINKAPTKDELVPDAEKKPTVVKVPQISHCYKRDEVSNEDLAEMRATEIRQLKRRFTTDKLRTVEESEANAEFVFSFSPTDPDWPFEVRVFDIAVSFTQEYPMKLFTLTLPEDQDLPETVRRYIEVSLEEWVKMKEEQAIRKGTVELLFRPFLRWLDRNMEELVTQALKQYRRELMAKAAGMEFKTADKLRKELNKSPKNEVMESEEGEQAEEPEVTSEAEPGVIVYRKSDKTDIDEVYEVPRRETTTSESNDDDDDDNDNDDVSDSEEATDETEHQRPKIDPDTERRGTELSFRHMQMWFCTTVLMEKLQLTIQCDRCKHTTDFQTPPNRVNSIVCGKCNTTQLVVFRAVLAHSYSSTFGYLDLDGCTVFDVNMQECHFSMGCIQCNRDVLVKRCTPGKLLEPFCRSCHNKMQFAAESVKKTKLTTEVDQSYFHGKVHKVNSKMLRKAAKDPAIQEGKPLPNNGACKHYKKSFRWLRFPCCGKCYPCDECHDDKEDHEMKYANRMICGFCCREQPFAAEKPCIGCSSALTKVRTTHWEGGRGCRDKISMSRNDNQKYANLHKTESRRSQALKEKSKGKKNTKLRHT